MAKNEKAIVQVIAKENDTTAVMKEVHKASDIEENDIISIKHYFTTFFIKKYRTELSDV